MTSISVIIATFNRADGIRETLEAMCELDTTGIDPVFIIVDNNSADNTAETIKSFSDRISVQYLFEPNAGKNNAVNKALDEGDIRDIIIFSDDDVTPEKDWLVKVAEASNANPDYNVFGGRIEVMWPVDNPPEWSQAPEIQGWGYCKIDFGDKPCRWPEKRYPGGPNYWIRKSVIENGRRFDGNIGPTPKYRIMGGETSFLKKLREDGYEMFYAPEAILHHRIQEKLITPEGIFKRALFLGRTGPHLNGISLKKLYDKSPNLWRAVRFLSAMRYIIKYGFARLNFNETKRVLNSIEAIRGFSTNWEMLRLSFAKKF